MEEIKNNPVIIKPQPGPQEMFLASKADIVIYGGGAGGGKTYGLLLEPLRHLMTREGFGGVIFRRTSPQIRNEGGLWDESSKVYPLFKAKPRESNLDWSFPPYGNTLSFSHLEHEKDIHDHQGGQYSFIGFDELTHFTKKQFFYLLSRNRSLTGLRGYIRATCNPDPDSWVADFISWWIDQDTGLPIPERSGVVRHMYRDGDTIIWGNRPGEILEMLGKEKANRTAPAHDFKSVTFIPALVTDNKILMEKDPGYVGNLKAQSFVDRERLLNGNWKVRASAGTVLKREWFEVVDSLPAQRKRIRFWDRAATEKTSNNDPDATAGTLMSKDLNGVYYIEHVHKMFSTPQKVESAIKHLASQDGDETTIGLWQDPGQAGKFETSYYVRALSGNHVITIPQTKSKLSYALPFAAQAEHGNVKLLRGSWNEAFLNEADNFSGDGSTHDDQVDSAFGAFNVLASKAQVQISNDIDDHINYLESVNFD